MNGVHLMSDLYGCAGEQALLLDRETLENFCVEACREGGLTPLGAHFHQFTYDTGEKAGVTGTVVLAESHLAIHTWPESGDVTIDVYVCNYSRDNSLRARNIMNKVAERFKPTSIKEHKVMRGEVNHITRAA